MNVTICIPAYTEDHPLLKECVENVRNTTGLEPVVWKTKENVSVAREEATKNISTKYILFLDTDAFPVEKNWHEMMVRVAEEKNAAIVSPTEIAWFGDDNKHSFGVEGNREIWQHIGTPNVAGMCLLVRKGFGTWDKNIGLTQGKLGPCIEDTDFARSVRDQKGTHFIEPNVHVLHKDRGTATMAEWMNTHEALCYRLMSELIAMKWADELPSREHFFDGLKTVPSTNQRFLAKGYTVDSLLDCYNPILSKLNSVLQSKATESFYNQIDRYNRRTSCSI